MSALLTVWVHHVLIASNPLLVHLVLSYQCGDAEEDPHHVWYGTPWSCMESIIMFRPHSEHWNYSSFVCFELPRIEFFANVYGSLVEITHILFVSNCLELSSSQLFMVPWFSLILHWLLLSFVHQNILNNNWDDILHIISQGKQEWL